MKPGICMDEQSMRMIKGATDLQREMRS